MQNLRIFAAISRLSDRFAQNLGVNTERKEQIYLDIAGSLALTDTSYWIQVLFSAGIATLGLVLNSPAVIIGAMLISPLMGSILANGLALATGDIILAARAILNLLLSCFLAITFAVLLVTILPFKEMTDEILARTQPNLLDLAIALFSGAVGAVAMCKEAKGAVTSIPGVSIAVALMPPLCVVGYGIGIALTSKSGNGLAVAQGEGLLFFTNLVAITLMAMLVFLALHIDVDPVRDRVLAWRESDRESIWVQSILNRLPAARGLKPIGSLPSRLLLILMTILVISVPLNESFDRLRSEVERKQQRNRLRNDVTEVWQKNFAEFADGKARSYISQFSLQEQDRQLVAQLQILTSKVYTEAERERYKQLLSSKLRRPVESIVLNLIQIPTASSDLLRRVPAQVIPSPPPTIAQLQSNFLSGIESALGALVLPVPARLVSYEARTSPAVPLRIQIVYLSDREIDRDGKVLLAQNIRSQLNYPQAEISFERIAPIDLTVTFGLNQSAIPTDQSKLLDKLGRVVRQYPRLQIEIASSRTPLETEEIATDRSLAVRQYFATRWQISPDRIAMQIGTQNSPIVQIETTIKLSQTSATFTTRDRTIDSN